MSQKQIVAPSREVVPVRFPLLSEKGLARFLASSRRKMPEIPITNYKINQPGFALLVSWGAYPKTSEDMSDVVDDILWSTMNVQVTRKHDEVYGKEHYYLYSKGRKKFVLMGDNCYGPEYGRLLLNWKEELRLPKDEFFNYGS